MISQERLDILEKIKQFEKVGNFDTDVENDPPSRQLQPKEIDYLRKKWRNKIARFFVSRGAEKAMNGLIAANQIIIKNVDEQRDEMLVFTYNRVNFFGLSIY